MSFIQNLFTSRDNNADGNTYVGQEGRVWWNPDANAFYYSDGNTAGGILISGGTSGNGLPAGPLNSVQVNAGGGNFNGTADFLFDPVANTVTLTGNAFCGNVFPVANNISTLGNATNRFTGLWLGSGDINLIDDVLNINQQINASDGNLVITGGTGLVFGDFAMYGNRIATINPAANINIGLPGDSGYVDIDRPIAVNSTGAGIPAFIVEQSGLMTIRVGLQAANTQGAVSITGSTGNAYQPVKNSGGMLHITGNDGAVSRITNDAFGTGSFPALISRAGRGTAASPTAVQSGDIMSRLSTVGWGTTDFPSGPAATNIEVYARENFTDSAQGTEYRFFTAPIGSTTKTLSATIANNGISFANSSTQVTAADIGITFRDGTRQTTAFDANTVVNYLTAAQGITLSSNVGNVTIGTTAVLGIVGTPNQISVTGNVGNVVTLGTPQDIAPTSNVQFNNLTVTNLSVIGNISNVIPSIVSGPIIYVANTASNFSDINNSGLVTGNVANSVWAGILYNTTSNTWVMDIGNSVGITASNVFADTANITGIVEIGTAAKVTNYPNALLQGDINIDSYGQYVLQNHSQTANASSDIVAVANNGNDGAYYIDMGINSNVYANVDYAVTGANDGYLYVNGGNLVIGTQTPAKVIKFFTDGTDNVSNVRLTINSTGVSVVGNLSVSNVAAATVITAPLISVTGNITGGNLLTSGLLSTTGNITGLNINAAIFSATANIVGPNVRVTGTLSAIGNVVGGNIVTGGIITSVGNIYTSANLVTAGTVVNSGVSTVGNVTGGNVNTGGNVVVTGFVSSTGNVQGGNLRTTGIVSATGNVTGNYFIGNGAVLTGINAFGNVYANGTAVLATSGSASLTLTPGNNQVIIGNNTTKAVTVAVSDNPTFNSVSVIGNITISGNVNYGNTSVNSLANIVWANTSPLGTAYAGLMEYDGRVLYFTPQDQERGVIPAQQYYVLNVDRGLTFASTTAQSLFGVGAHVSNSTRYWFRIKATVSRSSGTNNTAFTLGWRGTATPTTITYLVDSSIGTVSTVKTAYQFETELVSNFTNQVAVTTTSNPPDSVTVVITGIIDVGPAGVGYLDPYISYTGAAAPGSVVVESLSNFQIYPIGVTGANTSVGNWA